MALAQTLFHFDDVRPGAGTAPRQVDRGLQIKMVIEQLRKKVSVPIA